MRSMTYDLVLPVSHREKTEDGRGWKTVADGNKTFTIRIEIDEEAIVQQLGTKAARNRSGRAVSLKGLIVARRIKR